MKRYDVKPDQIRNPDNFTYGDFVKYDEAMEVIESLRKENVALKSQLEPVKIIKEAGEVTKDGFYKWKDLNDPGFESLYGEFIGPIQCRW